tara:strand:- start:881 stop:1210 length:330 start_codon:yes stop_codon:yes gene_type:complete
MNNFDLTKFLTEKKLTTDNKINEEVGGEPKLTVTQGWYTSQTVTFNFSKDEFEEYVDNEDLSYEDFLDLLEEDKNEAVRELDILQIFNDYGDGEDVSDVNYEIDSVDYE